MSAERNAHDAARARVWAVEDSALEAEVVRESLGAAYDVTLFASGETMLEQLASEGPPDLVVLDWHLPGLSGIELCRFLRANPATLALPVLLLTAATTSAEIVQGFAAGADDYLAKPFDAAELNARIAALVRGRQLRRRSERAEQTLRTLLAHLPDALVALDGRGAITFANAAAEQLLAQPLDVLVGRPLALMLPGLRLPPGDAGNAAGEHVALDDLRVGERVFAPVLRALGSAGGATGRVLVLRDVTLERRADAAVRESEERFRALAEAIPQIVWTASPDGAMDYFNPRWREYAAATPGADADANATFFGVVHPDDVAAVRARWSHSVASGEAFETELRLRRADGVYRWHLGRALAQRDRGGRLWKWFGTATDIDDQRRAQAQLDALLEAAPVGIALLDPELRYVKVNDALASANGVPRAAHLGRTVAEVLPAYGPVVAPAYRRVLETGVPIANEEVEGFAPSAPGRERHWLGSYYPVRVGTHAIGLATMVTEITAQKRSERALDFLAQAGVALASSLDSAGSIARLAALAVPALGAWCVVHAPAPAAAGALEVATVVHDDPRVAARLRELHAGDTLAVDAEHPVARAARTGHGALLADARAALVPAASVGVDPLPDLRAGPGLVVPLTVGGRVAGALTVGAGSTGRVYDLGDLRLAEELGRRAAVALENARLYELAQRERARVEEANRAKDEFLAMVSHELRTPLNAMLGWTRMLRTGSLPEEKRERALETIERNARAQTQLIEDLLDVSRIITGKLRLDVRPVDLGRVVDAALDAVRPAAAARAMRLRAELDRGVGAVMGDGDRLEQVVWNLLTNAIKFTPRGGDVRIALRQSAGNAEITVSDTGQGIPADFLPYVFERFRQADGGIARKHGGLGLGLAIVKHLVELHGGTIAAHSPGEGRGATFVVALPIPTDAEAAAVAGPSEVRAAPAAARSDARLEGLRVLVVDDEADARELLVSVLESSGAQVIAAADVRGALESFVAGRPDVLVSDIGLPGQDGYVLIRSIRELPAERGGRTPAVALTAYARAEDRKRALGAGYQTHVSKPVEPSELISVIAGIAGRGTVA